MKHWIKKIILIFIFSFIYIGFPHPVFADTNMTDEEITNYVKQIFQNRNNAILGKDLELLESIYDLSTKYGTWAYDYEVIKMKYIHNWAEKQGVKFTEITPEIKINKINKNSDSISINLICSTKYKYVYQDSPDIENTSRIGTYHTLRITNKEGAWIIAKEWYKDPFGDSLNLQNLKVDSIRQYILSQMPKDLSTLNKRRLNAIEYAKQYCGAASEEQYGYKYNKKYRDYNPQGGDCANFASQILYEGGKFKKNSSWNYDAGGATSTWLNADSFKEYMTNSGRASVITHGNYEQVYKLSFKLLPGDFVAYEKNNDITHISVVTGADSKGYPLVTCHNSDRNNVPWDLGWSNKNIKFWLVRVHY